MAARRTASVGPGSARLGPRERGVVTPSGRFVHRSSRVEARARRSPCGSTTEQLLDEVDARCSSPASCESGRSGRMHNERTVAHALIVTVRNAFAAILARSLHCSTGSDASIVINADVCDEAPRVLRRSRWHKCFVVLCGGASYEVERCLSRERSERRWWSPRTSEVRSWVVNRGSWVFCPERRSTTNHSLKNCRSARELHEERGSSGAVVGWRPRHRYRGFRHARPRSELST